MADDIKTLTRNVANIRPTANQAHNPPVKLNESNDGMPFKTSIDEVGEFLAEARRRYHPGQETLSNRLKQNLEITHVPTGFSLSFPAFIDTFNDALPSAWTQVSVYGRMDPIATFNGTERVLSLGWHVPATGFKEAEKNLGDVNQLISYMYPMYDAGVLKEEGATALNQSPLIRIRFGNLIVSSVSGDGLLGYCRGITFDPALEHGMFHHEVNRVPRYFPKTYRLNLELKVLHDHRLGFRVADSETKKIYESKADTSNSEYNVYRSKVGTTYTTDYSFNDDNISWNNFPYHTAGGTDTANSSQSTERIIIKEKKNDKGINPVFQRMFEAERLGTGNVWNALAFQRITQEEAEILLRGENIVRGELTDDGGRLVDYTQTGMNPNEALPTPPGGRE